MKKQRRRRTSNTGNSLILERQRNKVVNFKVVISIIFSGWLSLEA